MPKRLLIVTQHFWPEHFRINDMVDGFLADGIVVDIVCGLPNYPQGEWFSGYDAHGPMLEDYHGANLYRCGEIPRKGNTSLRIFLNYIAFPITATLGLRRLPGGYDAVLCYNTSPVLMSFPAIVASRKFKAPLTNYVLDIWPENLYSVLDIQNKALRKIASAVSDWHYRRADRLIAMNEGLAQRLRERVGSKNAKGCVETDKQYAVIPQYCEDFYDCKAGAGTPERNADDGTFQIQFAGNFSPAQSLDTVLDAMAMVKAQATTPIQLVLIGDGMSREALQVQANTLQLGNWVRFYGSVQSTEIPALAAQADALLIPLAASKDLGLTTPAKLASCMAAGKPLLISMDGEGARIAKISGGALVSGAGDAGALAQNILALAATPAAKRAEMGEASHQYYKEHFDRNTLLKQIENFIF